MKPFGVLARRAIWCGLALVLAGQSAMAAEPAWPAAQPEALKHWKDMRFGMFIHWGPVSLTAREIGWSRGAPTPLAEYDSLYKKFNPEKFNADEWVSIAKAAGMKYMVLTTKHHDGFCLWNTKLTDYNIMNSPFGRDVVKELSAACKKQNMAFGTYYSVTDWYNPNWPVTSPGGSVPREKSDLDAYEKYLQGQITELITNYGPLVTIWNDVPAMYGKRGAATIKMVRQLQPDILINDRTGDGGDYGTPEQSIGGFNNKHPWESCMTISAHNAWAWGGSGDGVKSLAQCLEMLIGCAGGDGNMLLNVGPTPLGEIAPEQAGRLKEMGQWMEKYGESIYGTRGGPYKPTKALVSTHKDDVIYVHVRQWNDETISLPPLPAKVLSAEVLGGGSVKAEQGETELKLTVAVADRHEIDTIIKLKLDSAADALAPIGMAVPGLIKPAMKVTASNVFQNDATYGPDKACDGDDGTRWATDAGTKAAWLEVDLGKPMTFDRVQIDEACGARVRCFELQYKDGDAWQTGYKGTTIGANFTTPKFPAITAQHVRLNILEATEGPTLNEWQLLKP